MNYFAQGELTYHRHSNWNPLQESVASWAVHAFSSSQGGLLYPLISSSLATADSFLNHTPDTLSETLRCLCDVASSYKIELATTDCECNMQANGCLRLSRYPPTNGIKFQVKFSEVSPILSCGGILVDFYE